MKECREKSFRRRLRTERNPADHWLNNNDSLASLVSSFIPFDDDSAECCRDVAVAYILLEEVKYNIKTNVAFLYSKLIIPVVPCNPGLKCRKK